jgi:hypothetical protein
MLPSGRRISYPEAKVVPGKFDGTYALRYKDNAKGRWADYDAWYGALVENAVQAIARDILAAGMRRIEAAGYPIVLTVHDEIVCEVPEGFGNLEEFHRLMVELPPWAEGLPLAAKGWTRPRYAKATIVADKPSVLPLKPISATPPISILPPESEIDTKAEVDVHTVEIKVGIDDGDEDGAHRGARDGPARGPRHRATDRRHALLPVPRRQHAKLPRLPGRLLLLRLWSSRQPIGLVDGGRGHGPRRRDQTAQVLGWSPSRARIQA